MPRPVSVFGLGYVGSVTATCLAFKGSHVLGVDINPSKVEVLNSGRSPVIEARMDELAAECHEACRLHATTDVTAAVLKSEISFICVGTPGFRNGKLDLSGVTRVCQDIGEALRNKKSSHLIVLRSTVLPGTTESLVIPALEKASGKRAGTDFAVCFNPEFLREGTAVADFMQPPFTILGAQKPTHLGLLRELYSGVPGRIFETSLAAAETVKYVCNAFHALKVSFAN